jgi:hypothetical protein
MKIIIEEKKEKFGATQNNEQHLFASVAFF